MNSKGLRILKLLQYRQMTRKEIAEALHEDMTAISDLVEMLHTQFQYIKLLIVNDGDIISTEPPAAKYTITPAGRAYLYSMRRALGSQMIFALTTAVTMFCFAGMIRNFQKSCYHMISGNCMCKEMLKPDAHFTRDGK